MVIFRAGGLDHAKDVGARAFTMGRWFPNERQFAVETDFSIGHYRVT